MLHGSGDALIERAAERLGAGDFRGAEALIREALASDAGNVRGVCMLAIVAAETGRLDEAVGLMERALTLAPNLPGVLNNAGVIFRKAGRLQLAAGCWSQALAADPRNAEVVYNMAWCQSRSGELDAAIAGFEEVLRLRPKQSETATHLGNALKDTGRCDDAIAAFGRGMAGNPRDVVCHSALLYALHFQPGATAEAILREHRRWEAEHAACVARGGDFGNERSVHRRLRVGYVSAHLRKHVIGANVLPLVENHDAEQFEVVCYSSGEADEVTARFRARAGLWRETVGMSDEALAKIIAADRIDILVDLALHLDGGRPLLFARKPAPVQVTFAGYPGTTGMRAVDYRLSDPYMDPPGLFDGDYAERTVRLPHSFWCFVPDASGVGESYVEPAVGALPAERNGVVTFGCLNNFCKVNEGVLRLWGRVMARVAGSRLVLMAPTGTCRERVLKTLGSSGIAAERVTFCGYRPHKEYLACYQAIDIGLDTFPYNGHTTSLDSMWMGVPVVTLVGETVVGRAGLSQLTNVGLPELIGWTAEEFVEAAVGLASDRRRLAGLRRTLRERMRGSALMDAKGFAAGIEGAYRRMWREWCGVGE